MTLNAWFSQGGHLLGLADHLLHRVFVPRAAQARRGRDHAPKGASCAPHKTTLSKKMAQRICGFWVDVRCGAGLPAEERISFPLFGTFRTFWPDGAWLPSLHAQAPLGAVAPRPSLPHVARGRQATASGRSWSGCWSQCGRPTRTRESSLRLRPTPPPPQSGGPAPGLRVADTPLTLHGSFPPFRRPSARECILALASIGGKPDLSLSEQPRFARGTPLLAGITSRPPPPLPRKWGVRAAAARAE